MGRREDLIRAEHARWEELNGLVRRLASEQLLLPGTVAGGWSVKDLMWHIAAWSADAARQLERMRAGTFEPDREEDTDTINARWLEESRRLDLETVKAGWYSARTRMLEEYGNAVGLPADADDWFEETGPLHYEEHLPDMRAWVAELTSER